MLRHAPFEDRFDAGRQLADRLRIRPLHLPLVLAIPRGGVQTGSAIAHGIGAELDVILARKLRAPDQPEFAIGAVAEDGAVIENPDIRGQVLCTAAELAREKAAQLARIAELRNTFRAVKPAASMTGRSVILTDDGIASGSTMLAAIHAARAGSPRELILAVPVAPRYRLDSMARLVDEVCCLRVPEHFLAVGQFYRCFEQVSEDEVLRLLRRQPATPPAPPTA